MRRSEDAIAPRVINPGSGADSGGSGGGSGHLEPYQAASAELDALIDRGQAVQRPGSLAGFQAGPGRAGGGFA